MLDPYLAWARTERGLSELTIRAYSRELRALGKVGPLEGLGAEQLRAHIHARGGKPATVALRVAACRSYYRWAVRTGIRDDDPTQRLDSPKVRRGLPRPVRDLDARLEHACERTQHVARFFAGTGLRIAEGYRVREEVPVPDELLVLGKGSKERIVPLSGAARAALNALGGRLPWSARTLERRFAALGFRCHDLRSTFATRLAAADVDLSVIQDLLGHASPETTRIYLANDTRRLRAGVEKAAA